MDPVYPDRGDRQRFVIEPNGNVYSCDFFVEPDTDLAIICQSKIIDLTTQRNSPIRRSMSVQVVLIMLLIISSKSSTIKSNKKKW